jgi:predicted nucleotidyltransferase
MPEQSGATDEAQDKLDVEMAAIPDAVAQAAVQQQRRVEAAYLYGSQVKGTSTQWSDIDVAVISPDFADLFQERLALMRLAAQIDDRIEPYPFKPQDFNSSDPLAGEIRLTGVRVA